MIQRTPYSPADTPGAEPLVSVIIPIYNVAPYLAEALESVLAQTHRYLEILLIDDGSRDASGAICEQYAAKDPRITVIHQENRGLSTARNVGLCRAAGQFIAFLDPDDAYHPEMLWLLLREMEAQGADVAVCDFSVHQTLGRMTSGTPALSRRPSRTLERDEALRQMLDGRINAAPWNKLYHRELWASLRFPDGRLSEGTYISFDLFSRARRIVLVDEQLVLHRNRPGSICHTFSLASIRDIEYARAHRYDFVLEHMPAIFSEEQAKRFVCARCRSLLRNYWRYRCVYPKDRAGQHSIRELLVQPTLRRSIRCCPPLERAAYQAALLFPRASTALFCAVSAVKRARRRSACADSVAELPAGIVPP